MARTRVLSDEQRLINERASRRKWVEANPEKAKNWHRAAYIRKRDAMTPEQKAEYLKRHREWNKRSREKNKTKVKARAKRYYEQNKDAINAKAAEWSRNNKEKRKTSRLKWIANNPGAMDHAARKSKYGILPEEFEALKLKQAGLCACCGRPPGRKALAVDHCHATGRVRGLLCGRCNTGIGQLGDTAERVMKAVAYLQAFESSHVNAA